MPLSGWARPFQGLDLSDDPGLEQTMLNAGLCRIRRCERCHYAFAVISFGIISLSLQMQVGQ
jgi:hypothetical protein